MTNVSLRKQFVGSTAVVVVVIMLASVIVIDFFNVRELEKSAQERLRLHIYSLLSVAEMQKGVITLPVILYNPEMNRKNSGLWAVVLAGEGSVVWQSLSYSVAASAFDLPIETGAWRFAARTIDGQRFLTAAFSLIWEDDKQYPLYFVVAEHAAIIEQDIRDFRWVLFSTVLLITALLLSFQYLVLRMAFRPINKLENEIGDMESGNINRLSGGYPKELSGVTRNLNALVEKEHQQRERYRAAMADLAHSLKTPITIITGEMKHYSQNKTLQDALARIDSSIEYQLRRAVISGHKLLKKGTQAVSVVNMVGEAMQKIYAHKNVSLRINADKELTFCGDENDLMEIVGNILDNAFRHAGSIVQVTLRHDAAGLEIIVEDDGPGLFDEDLGDGDKARIFQRGESKGRQGQGIGLAVVNDIVSGYGGRICAGHSTLGGAKFYIFFPHFFFHNHENNCKEDQ